MNVTTREANERAPAALSGPAWVVAEMPAGYQNRVAEIKRVFTDLEETGPYSRLLWQVGPQPGEAGRDVFAVLKLETEWLSNSPASVVAVALDGRRQPAVLCFGGHRNHL